MLYSSLVKSLTRLPRLPMSEWPQTRSIEWSTKPLSNASAIHRLSIIMNCKSKQYIIILLVKRPRTRFDWETLFLLQVRNQCALRWMRLFVMAFPIWDPFRTVTFVMLTSLSITADSTVIQIIEAFYLIDLLFVLIWYYYFVFDCQGDLNETLFIGEVDEESKRLTKVTYEAIMAAINIVKPGVRFREIGNVIQNYVSPHGFSVVRSYCGHGIHRLFHTAPNVPHYANNKAVGIMKAGNTFTIEPMISAGDWRDAQWPDNWTAVTVDGKRSAQFEQTLLVTETGCEILTVRREKNGQPWFMDKMWNRPFYYLLSFSLSSESPQLNQKDQKSPI